MEKKIAIIGGGIAGITCSIALQQQGIEADVFEQAPEIKEIGAVLGILPNGMEVLNTFGLVDYMLAKGGQLETLKLKAPDGSLLRQTDFHYNQPAAIIRRSDLLAGLMSKAKNERIFTQHRLLGIERLPNGSFQLNFAEGDPKTYDVVIGADGINSVARKYVCGDSPAIYRGYPLWRGVAKIDHSLDHSSETWGPNMRFGLYPLHDGWVGWWAAIREPINTTDEPLGSKGKLLKYFSGWHNPISDLIEATDSIIKNNISDRVPSKQWIKNNVVLVGDAAHCTTPNLGQGANMAMESALILARCMGKYGANSHAFRRYEDVQFERTRSINQQSLLIGKLGLYQFPPSIYLRNILLRKLPLSLVKKTYDSHYGYNAGTVAI